MDRSSPDNIFEHFRMECGFRRDCLEAGRQAAREGRTPPPPRPYTPADGNEAEAYELEMQGYNEEMTRLKQ